MKPYQGPKEHGEMLHGVRVSCISPFDHTQCTRRQLALPHHRLSILSDVLAGTVIMIESVSALHEARTCYRIRVDEVCYDEPGCIVRGRSDGSPEADS